MDDDYLNIYEYVGEEKHEYTATTNISKEEHEMKKMASPQEIQQQTQINQSSTDTHGFQKQVQEGAFKTTTKGVFLTLLIILHIDYITYNFLSVDHIIIIIIILLLLIFMLFAWICTKLIPLQFTDHYIIMHNISYMYACHAHSII